jgi:hypothetical protein
VCVRVCVCETHSQYVKAFVDSGLVGRLAAEMLYQLLTCFATCTIRAGFC